MPEELTACRENRIAMRRLAAATRGNRKPVLVRERRLKLVLGFAFESLRLSGSVGL